MLGRSSDAFQSLLLVRSIFFFCIVALVLKELRLRDGLKITFQNHFQALEKWHPEYVLGFDTTAPSFQRSRSSAVEDLRAASSFNGIRQKIARISTKEIMRFFLYRKLPFSSACYHQTGEFEFQHTEFKATMMIDQFLDAKWPPLSSLFSTREVEESATTNLLPFRAADIPGHPTDTVSGPYKHFWSL